MKLLFDRHIKKEVVIALLGRCPALEVAHIANWRDGAFRTAEDADVLAACLEVSEC